MRSSMYNTVIVNSSVTFDPMLKHLLPKDSLFQLPTDKSLALTRIEEFFVDQNKFEWWHLGDKYSVLIDQKENVVYLLQTFLYRTIDENEQVLIDESICLDRSGRVTRFDDFSGLIEIRLNHKPALIRLYSRETQVKDTPEYVFGVLTANNDRRISYYVGTVLSSISQLGV